MSAPHVLHLVTVGQSLLGRVNSHLPHLNGVLDPTVLRQSVAAQLIDLTRDGYLDPQTIVADGAALTALRAADPVLAAEWTSLAAYRSRPQHPAGDAVVYLASDTDEGLRAAVLLALRETRTSPNTQVRYVHDVGGEGMLIPEHDGEVAVVRIPGLDFAAEQSWGNAERTWQALGDFGFAVARTAFTGDWSVVLHLSGGFKAAIPYLLVMAEGICTRLRSIDGTTLTVTAVCVHESSVGQQRLPYLVDLPVRYLSLPLHEALRASDALDRIVLRGQFTTDPTSTRPVSLTWAGLILTRVLRDWP
jgi:hypothetical protein